jgi:hypothetical protein
VGRQPVGAAGGAPADVVGGAVLELAGGHVPELEADRIEVAAVVTGAPGGVELRVGTRGLDLLDGIDGDRGRGVVAGGAVEVVAGVVPQGGGDVEQAGALLGVRQADVLGGTFQFAVGCCRLPTAYSRW